MKQEDSNDFMRHPDQYLRNVAVDNVIFGYHDKELKVLLQQPFVLDKWTVAGGYIRKTESIEEAAHRVAFLRTGLKDLYLRQFHCFGSPRRSVDSGLGRQGARPSVRASGPQLCPDPNRSFSRRGFPCSR